MRALHPLCRYNYSNIGCKTEKDAIIYHLHWQNGLINTTWLRFTTKIILNHTAVKFETNCLNFGYFSTTLRSVWWYSLNLELRFVAFPKQLSVLSSTRWIVLLVDTGLIDLFGQAIDGEREEGCQKHLFRQLRIWWDFDCDDETTNNH